MAEQPEIALDTGYSIIWLDAHIGYENNCRAMKNNFQLGVVETAAVPPNPVNDLICAVCEYSAPIEFVKTEEETLAIIEEKLALEKKIIFISSATFGRKMIPQIQKKQFHIVSYYIFCGDIVAHREWGEDCINDGLDLQMFDHEKTLLIRLGRDMSDKVTQDGKAQLERKEYESALKYFQFAYKLADRAVACDTPINASDKHRPSTKYRPILDDLIKKTKQAMQ